MKELKERINLYIGTKVYAYIKIHFGYFYNGYILRYNKEEEKEIVFQDDKIGEVVIPITDIKHLTNSKRFSHGREA